MDWGQIEGTRTVISDRADLHKIMHHLQRIARESAENPKIVQKAAELAHHKEPVKAVFNYAYDTILYTPDSEGIQELRYSHNSIRDGIGNCTDYAILISSLFQNMGIAHKFRVVGYKKPSKKEHIYVVTDSGIVLDPVVGQEQDGTEKRTSRPSQGAFNFELPFLGKYDYAMRTKLHVLGTTKYGMNTPKQFAAGDPIPGVGIMSPKSTDQGVINQQITPGFSKSCYFQPYKYDACQSKPTGLIYTGGCGCGGKCGGNCKCSGANEVHIYGTDKRSKQKLMKAIRAKKEIVFQGHPVGNIGRLLGSIGNGGDYWNEDGDYDWDAAFDDGDQGGTPQQGGQGGGGMNINWQQAGNITQGILNLFKGCTAGCTISHLFNKDKRNQCKCRCAVEKQIPVTVDCCKYGVTAPGQSCTSTPPAGAGGTNKMLLPAALAIVALATVS